MARWKLKTPHYLNVPGTKWEYTENSRTSGRPQRNVYNVPLYLHPEDPNDWNWRYDRDSGDIIVCYEGKGDSSGKDIVFIGPPTPDMEPLDDEAKAISKRDVRELLQGESVSDERGGYAGKVLEELGMKLAEAMTNGSSASQDKLIETMAKVMEQNAAILSALTANIAVLKAERRV